MLVLSRKEGESIIIGDDIEIIVLRKEIINGQEEVVLGITAPKKISVHRKEVYQRIKGETH